MIKEITVTANDFKEYSKYAFARVLPPKAKGWRVHAKNLVIWFFVALVFLTIFESTEFSLSEYHWPSGLVTSLPFLIFIVIFIGNIKKIERNSAPKENGLMLGKRTIEINESGISDSCRLGTSTYKWEAFQGVEKHKGNVYLFLDTMIAQIFPASTFDTPDELDEFVEYIEKMNKKIILQETFETKQNKGDVGNKGD